MAYLNKFDFYSRINSGIVDQLTESNDTYLDRAEADATGIIIDRLGPRYEVHGELAKTSGMRNSSFLRWMVSLAAYFLYSKVPDTDIPERITKDYDDTLDELYKIATGKLSCSLPNKTETDGSVRTRMRMGSNPPRSHNPY